MGREAPPLASVWVYCPHDFRGHYGPRGGATETRGGEDSGVLLLESVYPESNSI